MRVLHIADRSFATREHAMLRRLEVGLVDEGIRLARCVPEGASIEPTTGLAGSLVYNDQRWRLGPLAPGRAIVRSTLEQLGSPADPEDPEIDVVHIWGEDAWHLGCDVAEKLGADVAIEVASAAALDMVRPFERRWSQRLDRGSRSALWLAPDEAMRAAIAHRGARWNAFNSRWGVHLPDEPARPIDALPRSLCIAASGARPDSVIAALTGLSRAARDAADFLAFLDDRAVRRHPHVWAHVEELGLNDRLSIISDIESRRQLILRTDALALPERIGAHTSIALEALAAGMLLICEPDPLVDALRQPGATIPIEANTPHAWEQALKAIFSRDRQATAAVARAARDYIRTERLAHLQVRATIDAYQALAGADPIPISQAPRNARRP